MVPRSLNKGVIPLGKPMECRTREPGIGRVIRPGSFLVLHCIVGTQ
jgi:hypothetical protein